MNLGAMLTGQLFHSLDFDDNTIEANKVGFVSLDKRLTLVLMAK